jgi:disulfide bond formation protein DsbB
MGPMSTFLLPVLGRWRLAALLASALLLAIAHGFETIGGLAPCALCLRQREVYWTAMGVAAAGMIAVRLPRGERWRAGFDLLLAAVFLAGVGVAIYHAGVEWKWWPGPTACAGVGSAIEAADLAALLEGARLQPPACDKPAWVFLGLSMAGWNALISAGLAALSLAAARYERVRR